MRLLGHLHSSAAQRKRLLLPRLEALGLEADIFEPMDWVAEVGPDYAGRYETVFARLASVLAPHRGALESLLCLSDPTEQGRRVEPETALGAALDSAFDEVMSLPNLVLLFGNEATQNPQQPFSRHFARQTRTALGCFSASENPFLWQMLAGRFPTNHPYDWLSRDTPPPDGRQERIFLRGTMREVLDGMAAESCHLVHLSNILDWLRPDDALGNLRSALRVLRPGGRAIIRQLNSCLDITGLSSGFEWDRTLGRSLLQSDRSFFYRFIHVGRKP